MKTQIWQLKLVKSAKTQKSTFMMNSSKFPANIRAFSPKRQPRLNDRII